MGARRGIETLPWAIRAPAASPISPARRRKPFPPMPGPAGGHVTGAMPVDQPR